MNDELVLNIWFIVDIRTELSTHFLVRCYNISGDSDKEKTDLLQKLAESDFKTIERIEYVGKARIPRSSIPLVFETDLEYFVQVAEAQLPKKIINSGNGDKKVINQKFSADPLSVCTVLVENEFGEMRTLTTPENKAWFTQEKFRIICGKNKS